MAVLEFPPAFSLAGEVLDFADYLGDEALPVDDAERLRLIEALERLKSAAAALQAETTVAYAAGKDPQRVVQAVATARHESPQKARTLVGVARVLIEEMPRTLAALSAGEANEWRATIAVRETALLSRENRALVDQQLPFAGTGDAGVARQARKLGFQLEPELAYKRAKAAEVDRRVTLRPAPDCMTILTAYLPVAEGVAVYAALTRAADSAAVNPEDGRSKGQVMADTLRDRVLGTSEPVPVEVQLVVPAQTLAGGREPAHVNGFGPIPAPLARQLADPPDQSAKRWLRRLWANPETGQLVAMESRSRFFPEGLRKFIVARDQYCSTPWCDAPIRQIDHIIPASQGGPPSADNGQGLCQACNLAKEA